MNVQRLKAPVGLSAGFIAASEFCLFVFILVARHLFEIGIAIAIDFAGAFGRLLFRSRRRANRPESFLPSIAIWVPECRLKVDHVASRMSSTKVRRATLGCAEKSAGFQLQPAHESCVLTAIVLDSLR